MTSVCGMLCSCWICGMIYLDFMLNVLKLIKFQWIVYTGDVSAEGSSGIASEEEVIYKEPSVYNNLLMKLGSSSGSLAKAFKIR